jgi:Cof subfamily protein (haloacid dehalogenase superfamily)
MREDMTPPVKSNGPPWIVALDIDGTTLDQHGAVSDGVLEQVRRLDAAGNHVMFATGRSPAAALPLLERFEIAPRFLVCSNGAITLHRDADAPTGYRREWVEAFDPGDVLETIRGHLPAARFAVEDELGHFRHAAPFPDATVGFDSEQVTFDALREHPVTRVVVISPDDEMQAFLAVVKRIGLHRVSYVIGETVWLDIAADGVNKATAMERVRAALDVPRERVMAAGDGLNDVELLAWAAERGRGVAMGGSPAEVVDAANELTGSVQEDGLAHVLRSLQTGAAPDAA